MIPGRFVSIEILGEDLDPDEVTEKIGLEPSNTFIQDHHSKAGVLHGQWSFGNTTTLPPDKRELLSFDVPASERVDMLLKHFEGRELTVAKFAEIHSVVLLVFEGSFDDEAGLELSSYALRILGKMGASFDYRSYLNTPPQDTEPSG